MRVVICGAPHTGKTTLANEFKSKTGVVPRHTDEIMNTLEWSAQSDEVATWIGAGGPYVIEGVTTVRALRKALASTAEMPCEKVIFLHRQHQEPATPGGKRMTKAVATVWDEIKPQLIERGVRVEERW